MKICKRIGNKIKKKLIKPKQYKDGNLFIAKMSKQLTIDDVVIFVVWHYGDMILGMIYLDEIIKKYNNKKIIIVYEKEIIKEWYKKFIDVVEFIKYDNFLKKYKVSKEECVGYIKTSCCNIKGMKYNLFNTLTCFNKECQKGKNKTIIYNLQNKIFKLPKNSKFTEPKPLCPIKFKYKLNEKDIIINPYSDCFKSHSIEIFQLIANLCLKKGYNVYTNVLPYQKELYGTKRLECSLDELFFITKEAKCIISIRSGVLDFLSFSGAHIISIYNRLGKNFFDLYTLKQFNNKNIQEIYLKRFSFKNKKYILNKIENNLICLGE